MNHIKPEIERINISNYLLLKGKKRTICAYCDEPFDNEISDKKKTSDHFIPKAVTRGTKEHFKSAFYSLFTVRCCSKCNEIKADMMPTEFRDFILNSKHENRSKILFNLNSVLIGH